MSGKVVHFEIPADDVERAGSFYREAFGWQVNGMPGMGYTLLGTAPSGDDGVPHDPGAINGGMFKREAPFTGPVITIEVDDVDEALARVEKLGGKVVAGREAVGDMGYSGYFSDTEGNLVGVWETRTA